jgi:PAS domain S-box-containing protein
VSGIQPVVGVLYVCIGLGALGFLKPAVENPETAGSWSFAVFSFAVSVYALSSGLDLFTGDYALSVLAQSVTNCAGVLVGVSWLFLTIEVSDRLRITRALTAGFAAYVVLAWLFALVNPFGLVLRPTTVVGTQLELDAGPGFWFLLGTAWIQVLAGVGLLSIESVQSTGIRQKQTGLLALAILPALAASIVNAIALTGSPVGYDYTGIGWAGTLTVFAVALYSSRFLGIETIARRTAMEEMDDAMVTLDSQDRVVDANPRALELLDVDGEHVGMPAAEFFHPVPGEVRQQFADVTDTLTETTVPMGGRERQFLVSVSPVGAEANRGRVIVFRDITEQKRREQRLRRQRQQLDQFASVVSHDLRNPLSVVHGCLDLVEDDIPEERAAMMRRNLTHMDRMIDDLLTMSRAGETVEDPETVALRAAVDSAWNHIDTSAATLATDIPDGTTVQADGDRLLRVFENLFRNATEHNDRPASIRVGILDTAATDGDGTGILVADDGTGIPEGERSAVFEHGYSTAEDGTGLGLSIVQDIVEAHGWGIDVTESSEGGARFEITGVDLAGSGERPDGYPDRLDP